MTKAKVCFAEYSGLRSWIVKKMTGFPMGHVWIEYDSVAWGVPMAIHSSFDGVVIEPAERVENRDHTVRVEKFESQIDLRPGFKRSIGVLGKKYDFFTLIWNLILLFIFRKTGEQVAPKARDRNRYTCSELVAYILKNAHVPGVGKWIAEYVAPKKLYDFIQESEDFRWLQ